MGQGSRRVQMKKLPTVITLCPECPFYRFDHVNGGSRCRHWLGPDVPLDDDIPYNCPLEDAKVKP
jgi:hypothetical protein